MTEKAMNGMDMADFKDGDITRSSYLPLMIKDPKIFEGLWMDIKEISDPIETILEKSGVGWIKRKATAIATLQSQITITNTDSGNPTYHFKTWYPLNISKECICPTDGSTADIKDPDTCDWKSTTVYCDGRLVQKRVGKNGIMFDSRCVFEKHPSGKHSAEPIMLFLWTMIDTEGKKHQANCWMKKAK